jgi:hypothetical protein
MQHAYKTADMLAFLGFLIHKVERYSQNKILRYNITPIKRKTMAHHKRSMKHRKSSRRHLKARRTRARRGGGICKTCGKDAGDGYNTCVPCSDKWRKRQTNSANLYF